MGTPTSRPSQIRRPPSVGDIKRQATKTVASPVLADCRRVGVGTAGGVGRQPLPSRRPDSMTARRPLASRQASEPEIIHRDVPRPPHFGTSYSNPMAYAWTEGNMSLVVFGF